MLSLRFRAKDIRDYEKKVGKSIYTLIEDNSLDNIVEFIKMGAGCDEDKAFDLLDIELEKPDIDTTTIFFDIMGQLQRYGFLPKKLKLMVVKEKFIKEMEQMNIQLEENGLSTLNQDVTE